MADVQLEHGYTRIANELLEALARAALPGRHFQVMLAMVRQLYGFNRAEDRISASQIAQATQLDAANVRRVLSQLVLRGMLQADAKAGRITAWRIQKDHEQWSDLGRRQPRSSTTQVAGDLGRWRPTTQVAGDLGTQVAGDLHQRQKDILKTEETLSESRPALELLPPSRKSSKRARSYAPEALSAEDLEALRSWCREKFPGLAVRIDDLVAACLDWHRSKGNLHADWTATARTWVRRAADDARESGRDPAPPKPVDEAAAREQRRAAAARLNQLEYEREMRRARI